MLGILSLTQKVFSSRPFSLNTTRSFASTLYSNSPVGEGMTGIRMPTSVPVVVDNVLDRSEQCDVDNVILTLPQGLAFKVNQAILPGSVQDTNHLNSFKILFCSFTCYLVGDLLVNIEQLPKQHECVSISQSQALFGRRLLSCFCPPISLSCSYSYFQAEYASFYCHYNP